MENETIEPVNNEQPQPQEQPPEAPVVETVPKAEIEKYASQIKELERKHNEAMQKLKEKEMFELQKNQEWQKVAEIKENEAKEYQSKYEGLKEALVRREKYNALAQAALTGGIRKEAISDLSLVDLNDLKVETTKDGNVNVLGAEKMIQKLKTLKPHWFQSSQPNVNPKSPSATSTSTATSFENLKKLEQDYKKNPMSKQAETAYREALLAFKK